MFLRSLSLTLLSVSLLGSSLLATDPGTTVEDFALTNVRTGQTESLFPIPEGEAVALIFISTGCPYSNAFNHVMAELSEEYGKKGVRFIGINSNKNEPFESVKDHADRNGLDFAVLKDEGSRVADQFAAVVTPEVFLIDESGKIRYHGALGNSRMPTTKKEEANGEEMEQALDALLAGVELPVKQTKMFGCTIKR